jgi:hypothetical protein
VAAIECEASREGLFLNYRNVKRGLKSGRDQSSPVIRDSGLGYWTHSRTGRDLSQLATACQRLTRGEQKPIMLSLVVSPTLTVSAISTVPTVPAILWHRRRTSGVELRLWGVIQGAVVCPGLRH